MFYRGAHFFNGIRLDLGVTLFINVLCLPPIKWVVYFSRIRILEDKYIINIFLIIRLSLNPFPVYVYKVCFPLWLSRTCILFYKLKCRIFCG